MEAILNVIEKIQNLSVIDIPLAKLLIVGVIFFLALVFKNLFVKVFVIPIERLTEKTETDIDDRLIAALKTPIGWLILLGAGWISTLTLSPHFTDLLNERIGEIISLAITLLIGFTIYSIAPILGDLVSYLARNTETELDDLFAPYLPKLFRVGAIVLVLIKGSNILLGDAAAALIGLIGGAGVALGLLLKDIIYDWCCTIIIFVDGLYRPGDWIAVSGVPGFAMVQEIGLRTTKLWIVPWCYILKMPNSRMISGIVENWSQDLGEQEEMGIEMTLKIDSISARKTEAVMEAIGEKLKTVKGISSKIRVRFYSIEGNARVLKIIVVVNDINAYYTIETGLNIQILEALEQEGVQHLSTLNVALAKNMQEMNPTNLIEKFPSGERSEQSLL